MEVYKDIKEADIGDLVLYKNKPHVVIGGYYDTGFMVKRIVNINSKFRFALVKEIGY
jgi:hypothetical protein